MDHQLAVQKADNSAPSQREYLKNNADRYPTLKPLLNEEFATRDKTLNENQRTNPDQREQVPKTKSPEKQIDRNPTGRQKIEPAKNYHERTWEKTRPSTDPQKRQPTPSREKPAPSRKHQPTPVQPGNAQPPVQKPKR
jgi:hypothetical protein